MDSLVSVIVPVFNVEKYLDQCVRSLLAQTYQNYEIILVDDGSPDNCPAMCDTYAEQHENVTVFHKENGGLSDARNYGVQRAKGDWIIFVDSDDYVAENYIEYLFNLREKFNADMAVAGFMSVYRDIPPKALIKDEAKILPAEDTLKRMCYSIGFGVSACAKLWPKHFLKKYPFPVGQIYEDLATTYKIVGECKYLACSSSKVYYYRRRTGSITQTKIDAKHLYAFTIMQELLDYATDFFPGAIPAVHCRWAIKVTEFMPQLLNGTKDDKKIFKCLKKELKTHYKIVMLDYGAPLKVKIKSTAMMLGYWPAVLLWKCIAVMQRLL